MSSTAGTSKSAGAQAIASKGKTATPNEVHPKYISMITTAITTLKERTGSSLQSIQAFISVKYRGLRFGWERKVAVLLRKNVDAKKIVKEKGSYKLGASTKRKPSKAKAKAASANAAPRAAETPAASTAVAAAAAAEHAPVANGSGAVQTTAGAKKPGRAAAATSTSAKSKTGRKKVAFAMRSSPRVRPVSRRAAKK
jgi:histone H1/5